MKPSKLPLLLLLLLHLIVTVDGNFTSNGTNGTDGTPTVVVAPNQPPPPDETPTVVVAPDRPPPPDGTPTVVVAPNQPPPPDGTPTVVVAPDRPPPPDGTPTVVVAPDRPPPPDGTPTIVVAPDRPPPPDPSSLPPATTTIVSPPPLTHSGSNSSKTWIIVSASSGSAVIVFICILVFFMVKRKKRPTERSMTEVIEEDVVTAESQQFDLNIIRNATENFSEANKLGQGGFGSVYKGKLPSGQEIAVKRLSQNSGQGESEFKNEARLLSRLQHRNLVRLLGYCLEGIERLLVYEFVPNSSLDKFIFDPLKRGILGWDTRYKIITGITRGLVYLHEDSRLRIIHRDLKAANILLDMDMNPKLSDFGMARLFELDQTQADTDRIMGTYGYMAPEYAGRGTFSVKSDAFSFGVLVLEIVCGRRNIVRHYGEDSEMLISHAWSNWRVGNISNIEDPAVSSGCSSNILRCIHIGLLCVQENATDRPEMSSVVRWLDNEFVALPVPTQPGFFTSTSSGDGNDISSVFDSASRSTEAERSRNKAGTSSINEASITKPYPR